MGFVNYNETCKTYDKTRGSVGIEFIIGTLVMSDVPISKQVILDAGCGTGKFIECLIDMVGEVHGLDINENMLSQIMKKCPENRNLHLKIGSMANMPYPERTFDAVLINQALQHIDTERNGRFYQIEGTFNEVHRVLKSNGNFVLNLSLPHQLPWGFWWMFFMPYAMEELHKRTPTTERIEFMLEEAGFELISMASMITPPSQGEYYFEPNNMFSQEFRDGDSAWSLLSDDELGEVLQRIQKLCETGEIHQFINSKEQIRKQIGQSVSFHAQKDTR